MSYKFGSFENFGVAAVAVLAIIGIFVVVGFLVAFPIMLLWNWLMPTIFHLPEITFWQALGLYLLAKGLFGVSTSGSKK